MYSGNSTVVNWLMRFPVLIPVAVAIGVVTTLPDPTPLTPPVEVAKVEPPVVVPPPVVEQPKLKMIDELCPPEGTKVSKKEKLALLGRGCKVKG